MLTFVVPVAPYHEALAERAVASCLAQTLVCRVVVVTDHDRRGAGWARNRGLEYVTSDFVSFLDADDWLSPTFAEETLRAYDGRHYVYTDWWKEASEVIEEAPVRAWVEGTWHVITTLLPTAFVRHVGGFDETLEAGEDTDLYLKLKRARLCGKRLARPLFHYSKDGQRSKTVADAAAREALAHRINARYGGSTMPDNCCGGTTPMPDIPPNAPQDGDVLAQALWGGNRQERGRATGRLYPRTGNGHPLYAHPADIDAAPHLFARIVTMPPALDDAALEQFRSVARTVMGTQSGGAVLDALPPAAASEKPDVGRVLRLYQGRAQPETDWKDGIPR